MRICQRPSGLGRPDDCFDFSVAVAPFCGPSTRNAAVLVERMLKGRGRYRAVGEDPSDPFPTQRIQALRLLDCSLLERFDHHSHWAGYLRRSSMTPRRFDSKSRIHTSQTSLSGKPAMMWGAL